MNIEFSTAVSHKASDYYYRVYVVYFSTYIYIAKDKPWIAI